MKTKSIQVFLLTYNRPLLLAKAIDSILSQEFKDFELIVSDNSTDDLTEKLISERYNESLSYRRRIPTLAVIEHFNIVLREVESEYFMLFHDDDTMIPSMLGTLFRTLEPSRVLGVLAVGANAILSRNGFRTNRLYSTIKEKNLYISSVDRFIELYLSKRSTAPFASYLYAKTIADFVKFNPEKGGKYCDVAFLLDIIALGKVVNLSEPLMILNEHSEQDSRRYDFLAYNRLLCYMIKISNFSRRDRVFVRNRLYHIYWNYISSRQNNVGSGADVRKFLRLLSILCKYKEFILIIKFLIREFSFYTTARR